MQCNTWNILFADPAVWDVTELGKDKVWIQWQVPMGEIYIKFPGVGHKVIPSAVESYMFN